MNANAVVSQFSVSGVMNRLRRRWEYGLRNQNSTFIRSLKSESAQNSTEDRTRYENKFQLDDNEQYYRNGTFPLQVHYMI